MNGGKIHHEDTQDDVFNILLSGKGFVDYPLKCIILKRRDLSRGVHPVKITRTGFSDQLSPYSVSFSSLSSIIGARIETARLIVLCEWLTNLAATLGTNKCQT